MYCVLDHAWRDPAPKYLEGNSSLNYTMDEFISNSMSKQVQAFQQISEFKQASDAQFAQQQFDQQQQKLVQLLESFHSENRVDNEKRQEDREEDDV